MACIALEPGMYPVCASIGVDVVDDVSVDVLVVLSVGDAGAESISAAGSNVFCFFCGGSIVHQRVSARSHG